MSEFNCDRLVVIGVGLIGGSVAAALRRAGKVRRIVGVGRGRANMERALELRIIVPELVNPDKLNTMC